ncbi:carbonic anhydrase [Acetobacter orientalis]|uniref:Carbonic anhydrase n=1 Tax=Acetobacter orientalis TaxID=146474 RepID=A0A252B005_9PROT|nr:carbonic anhydrase [Acetobacter orientalis]MDN6041428.1 carbonic anhydrase [Acetobacter sp.]MCP1214865.1 carbonic anhydrase [Acetobacter orientalis]MCP1218448.1 carbonic anhydrase [Acetobacter orientalis]MCP1220784.1 carbonic anhydrase [Acetobacter orientalis]OUI81934.1 carbonic anhydrase [Acetobacter orientalis]
MPTCSEARSSLISLLRGVEHFNTEVFPAKERLFASLAGGQSPDALFIACADSRINPNLITQTEPGDLFILRNIGNIVPAYGEMLGGVSSAIEYAVLGLGVSSIIVCGHSDCGAMKALMAPEKAGLDKMPTVASWLRNAEAARAALGDFSAEDAGPATVRSLSEQNVLLQIAHLRTHPAVAAGLARGTLFLQGWFYDIGSGEISILDEQTRTTVSIADSIANLEATEAEKA